MTAFALKLVKLCRGLLIDNALFTRDALYFTDTGRSDISWLMLEVSYAAWQDVACHFSSLPLLFV